MIICDWVSKFAATVGLIFFALVVSACAVAPSVPPKPDLKIYSSEPATPTTGSMPACKGLFDNYCGYLYSPEALGNIEIKRGQTAIQILEGDTNNQISQVFYRYSWAKIRNQHEFPKDFYRVLTRSNYFSKLESFLRRKPRESMSLAERLQSEQLGTELSFLWQSALNEALMLRVASRFPKYYRLSDNFVPVEWDLERRRIRRNLISEISQAVWKNDENWSRVEQTFSRLKESYLSLIQHLDIEPALRADWTERIKEVKLVLPGSIPEIANEECSATTSNAYYFTYLNVLTVCAGDFNSEDILQTLSHELGHALDFERTKYIYTSKSQFGQSLAKLRRNVCEPQNFSCEEWHDYRDRFSHNLESLSGFQAQLPSLQQCLKRRPTVKVLTSPDSHRIAEEIVNDRVSDLATSDRFLRITKSTVPMPDGKSQRNLNFLNPCSYYLWSRGEEPVDDELTTLMYFTAEYRCTELPPAQRLKNAIDVAKEMTVKLVDRVLSMEGEFSDRVELENAGFASPPEERFADVIGSHAMAEFLNQIPQVWDRRNKFLAGASWLCLAPSLASHFPEENSVQSAYVNDAHADADQRRKELFTSPLRESIGCEKDFEFKECELPLAHDRAAQNSSFGN